MSYILKKDKADEIKIKHKCKTLADDLGKTQSYISLLINQKITCPKTTAIAFTKMVDENLQIEDLFDFTNEDLK